MFLKKRLFQKMAVAIFSTFMGILVLVTVVAHMRTSGSTRQDMAKAQSQTNKVQEITYQEQSQEN